MIVVMKPTSCSTLVSLFSHFQDQVTLNSRLWTTFVFRLKCSFIPPVAVNMSLLLPLTIVCSLVAAQPYFQQPPSSQDNLLGKRCFAYSTLNALKECGIYDFNDHAGTADDWIRAHFANDDGGSPARVVQQLTQEGIQGVQLKMYGPNPPPPTQNIITKTRKIGTANRIGNI